MSFENINSSSTSGKSSTFKKAAYFINLQVQGTDGKFRTLRAGLAIHDNDKLGLKIVAKGKEYFEELMQAGKVKVLSINSGESEEDFDI